MINAQALQHNLVKGLQTVPIGISLQPVFPTQRQYSGVGRRLEPPLLRDGEIVPIGDQICIGFVQEPRTPSRMSDPDNSLWWDDRVRLVRYLQRHARIQLMEKCWTAWRRADTAQSSNPRLQQREGVCTNSRIGLVTALMEAGLRQAQQFCTRYRAGEKSNLIGFSGTHAKG